MLQIKVFGTTPPCASCKRAEAQALKAAEQFPERVEVVKLDALGPEAAQYGLMVTPMVVVGDKAVIPTSANSSIICSPAIWARS